MRKPPTPQRLIAEGFVFWLAAVLLYFAICWCANAFGDPSDPVVPPELAQFDSLKAKYAQVDGDLRDTVERYQRLQTEYAALEAGALTELHPGDAVAAGGRYRFPATPLGYAIDIAVPDVQITGGKAFSSSKSPCVRIRPGVAGVKIRDVAFGDPTAGKHGQKLGVGPAIQDEGTDTSVEECTFDNTDDALRVMPGSVRFSAVRCYAARTIRGNACYLAGAVDPAIVHCNFEGSECEIPLRASPENGQVTSNLAIVHTTVRNDWSIQAKAPVDIRQVTGGAVFAFSRAITLQGVTAAGVVTNGVAMSVGPPVDGDHPVDAAQVADNVYIVGSEFVNGRVQFKPGAHNPWMLDNTVRGLRLGIDVPVYMTASTGPMLLTNPTIVNLAAYADGKTSKPVVRVAPDGAVIPGADFRNARWVTNETPTTRPNP